jgi:hypothetical protein
MHLIAVAWQSVVGQVGIIGGAVLAVGGIVRWCYKFASRVEQALEVVRRELIPNGGGSLCDKVDTMMRRTEMLEHWRAQTEIKHIDDPD